MTDIYAPMRTTDLNKPSWITQPFWQWVTGTVLVGLIVCACAIPVYLLQQEQTERSNSIVDAAVSVVCGNSAFIDKITTPITTPQSDPAQILARQAANQRAREARNAYRALQPKKYLNHCHLAP